MNTVISGISASWPYINWIVYGIILIIIFRLFVSVWLFWRQELYKHHIFWHFLEIKIPRETLKGPKAMDQFLSSLYPLRNKPGTPIKIWWNGEVPRYHIIDIIGRNNDVRFYLRVSSRLSQAVQGLLYAQYPEIEIIQTEDPFNEFPRTYDELQNRGYLIFGNELYQTGSPAQAIRTYNEFEEEHGDEKGRIIDPFSVLLELIGNLKPEEMILVQFVLMPYVKKFAKEEARHILEKIRNTTQEVGVDKEGKPLYKFRQRTPGEEGFVKRIEEKRDRSMFETTIRYVYISPKEDYNFQIGYRGIQTFFNQFRHDRQTLERNLFVMTKAEWYYFPFFFKNWRLFWKRKVFYDELIHRFLPVDTFAGKLANSHLLVWCFFHKPPVLSTEELATLFHIPTNVVLTQPHMERIESKRLAAPANIPE